MKHVDDDISIPCIKNWPSTDIMSEWTMSKIRVFFWILRQIPWFPVEHMTTKQCLDSMETLDGSKESDMLYMCGEKF